MLVRRFVAPGRHGDDDDLHRRLGQRVQVGQAGLLPALAKRDGERVVLAGIGVPADLEPALHALVPAEQHPPRRRVDDERRAGDVHGVLAGPARFGADALDIGRVVGMVAVQELHGSGASGGGPTAASTHSPRAKATSSRHGPATSWTA